MQSAQDIELAVRQLAASQDANNDAGLSQAQKIHRRPSASSGVSGKIKLPNSEFEILPTIPPTPIDSYPPSRDEPMERVLDSNLHSSAATIEMNLTGRRTGIQERPSSFPTTFHEVVFALICSLGQLFFAW